MARRWVEEGTGPRYETDGLPTREALRVLNGIIQRRKAAFPRAKEVLVEDLERRAAMLQTRPGTRVELRKLAKELRAYFDEFGEVRAGFKTSDNAALSVTVSAFLMGRNAGGTNARALLVPLDPNAAMRVVEEGRSLDDNSLAALTRPAVGRGRNRRTRDKRKPRSES